MKSTVKKLLTLLLAVIMVFCFVACKGSGDTSSVSADNSSVADSSDVVTSEEAIDSSDVSQGDESSSSNSTTSTSSTGKTSSTSSNNTTSSSGLVENPTDYEKPYEGNAAILCNPQSSKYDAQAEALRKKIVNSKDASLKGDVTYYVSYKGKDTNNGLSKNTPWKSIAKVQEMIPQMPANTVILFERGGVYRGTLILKSNMSLGAYGTGQKPCIYGSPQNYAVESMWTQYATNIWKISPTKESDDIGCVVFDHGKKVTVRKMNIAGVKKDYDMFFANGTVYLYLSKGNPAKIHDDIEMSGITYASTGNTHIITGEKGIKNVVIENICFKYGGIHGINFVDSKNITIRYCELGYIGGAAAKGDTWCGNAIQFWENCDGAVIDHCWVYQVYDAGITHQATRSVQQNVTFSNNLIEYCAYNIEYFVDQKDGEIKNVTYSDNILRFAGGGWAHPLNRRGAADGGVGLIVGWGSDGRTYKTTNFVIKNNILDTSYRYMLNISKPNESRNAVISGNTYYQVASTKASICIADVRTEVRATSASQFKEEVAKIDATAKVVEFVEK